MNQSGGATWKLKDISRSGARSRTVSESLPPLSWAEWLGEFSCPFRSGVNSCSWWAALISAVTTDFCPFLWTLSVSTEFFPFLWLLSSVTSLVALNNPSRLESTLFAKLARSESLMPVNSPRSDSLASANSVRSELWMSNNSALKESFFPWTITVISCCKVSLIIEISCFRMPVSSTYKSFLKSVFNWGTIFLKLFFTWPISFPTAWNWSVTFFSSRAISVVELFSLSSIIFMELLNW